MKKEDLQEYELEFSYNKIYLESELLEIESGLAVFLDESEVYERLEKFLTEKGFSDNCCNH